MNFHSIKYIIILHVFSCYQNLFLFSQNKFGFDKKHFDHILFYHSNKIYFFSMNFSFNSTTFSDEHIWSSICIYKSQNFTFHILIELGCRKAVKRDIRVLYNES